MFKFTRAASRPRCWRPSGHFWGLAACVGIAISFLALQKQEFVASIALLFANLFLLLTAVSMGQSVLRALRGNGPLIEITESTFFDRRICLEPVPWQAIQWRAVYVKSGSIQLDVSAEFQPRMRKSRGDRFAQYFCRLLGYPRYTVSPLATGLSLSKLEELFARYKAPLRKKETARTAAQAVS